MSTPYSEGYHVVAILSPAPGKIDRILQELEKVSADSLAHESGTIKYELSRGVPAHIATSENPNIEEHEEIYMSEIYKDRAAYDTHMSSSLLAELFALNEKEQLLTKAPDIRVTRVVGGFDRTRESK